ncbi:Lrp/AsnC family transcriptional regulator [Streptomyces sp. NPDC054796]
MHRRPHIIRRTVGSVELDALDLALLRELQNDARQTNRDLAAKTGVSPSTSLERVRLLRERGVITGYHAALDLDAAGRPLQALISVRIRPPARAVIEGFREWAARLPEVIGLFVTSGSHDFLLHIAVPDVDGVYAFVIDRLTERREVADVQTTMVYEHVQSRRIEPTGPARAHPRAGSPGNIAGGG